MLLGFFVLNSVCPVYSFCCSELGSAAAAGASLAGRKFAGKLIEVEFIPESTFVAMFPSTNFAAM